MVKFIKRLFFKKEKEDHYSFKLDNPAYIRKQLLWYWTKYLEGEFTAGRRPMTYKEWQQSKVLTDVTK